MLPGKSIMRVHTGGGERGERETERRDIETQKEYRGKTKRKGMEEKN